RGFAFGNHNIVGLGPGGYGRNAAEPCPQAMQRSPRLASQASRSWSHSEAPLQKTHMRATLGVLVSAAASSRVAGQRRWEERRVGKERRTRGGAGQYKEKERER